MACSPIAPQSEFSTPTVQKCTPHDPAKAKQLLSEAGVKTPFPITMITSNNPDSLRLAQALQSMVKDGGFDLKIKPVEYAIAARPAGPRRLRAAAARLVRPGRPRRQHHQLRRHRRQPERRRLQRQGDGRAARPRPASPSDLAPAQAALRQAVDKLHQDDPLIYLYRQRNLTGVSNTVKGVQVFPDGVVRVGFAGFGEVSSTCGATCSTVPGSRPLTLLLATVVVFLGVRALPGDPALALAGEDRTPETLAAIRQQYGLDQSLPVQFWRFVSQRAAGRPRASRSAPGPASPRCCAPRCR